MRLTLLCLSTTLLLACGGSPEPVATPPVRPAAAAPVAQPGGSPSNANPAAPRTAYAAAGVDSVWGGGEVWSAKDAEFGTSVLPIASVLDNPKGHAGAVVIEGQVADVCQKKGCWTVLSDGKRTLRVTMKDHAFGIPMDSSGATAQVKGELVSKPLDPKTVEHYKSESARPQDMPEAGLPAGATETWELVATAVRVRK